MVIVESPAKSKTIEKYLGSDYQVLASFGHVRDLPKKELGVDVHDGGVYYSSPLTTGAKFESPAEMQHLLAPAYQQKQIDALYNAFNELLGFSEIRNYLTQDTQVDLASATKLAINGSVWVSGGTQMFKFA